MLKILGIVLDAAHNENPKLLMGIIRGVQMQAVHTSIGGEPIGLVEIYFALLLIGYVGDFMNFKPTKLCYHCEKKSTCASFT